MHHLESNKSEYLVGEREEEHQKSIFRKDWGVATNIFTEHLLCAWQYSIRILTYWILNTTQGRRLCYYPNVADEKMEAETD